MTTLSKPTTGRDAAGPPRPSVAWPWAIMLGIAAVYFAAAKLGLTMAFVAEQVTAVWPPTGIALAALLLFGERAWPGIALGAFLANATTNAPLATALGIAAGNTLEALIGAGLLRRFVQFDTTLERLKGVLGLIALAAIASTMVSATIGVTSLCLGGVQPWAKFGSLWWVWWLGDATGALVMAPVLLTWAATRRRPRQVGRPVEAGALIVTLIIMSMAVFMGLFSQDGMTHPLVYFIVPFIIWAALRFGQAGTTTVTFVASGIAIWGTVYGLGPFARGNVNESLIHLQLFMAVVAVTGLVLGAAIAEGRRAERRAAAQYATSRILAESKALDDALPRLLESVCRNLDWDVGAVWTAGRDEDELRLVQLWHEPTRQAPVFEAESRRRRFPPGIGLPGRVWATARPLWLANVIDDTNFPRVAAAAREGLRGAFGVPIMVGTEARGVMEFFSREVRPPDDELLETMSALGHQVGQFIDRTRAEEARLASEARKAAILENALDCIITYDAEGRVVEWNPAAERTFGYDRAEAAGRPLAELVVPPRLREPYRRGRAHYLETGECQAGERIEVVGMRKDGSEFPVELSVSVIRPGARPLFTAHLRDVTEQKRAARELGRSEERYRTFIRQSSEGIWRFEASEPIPVDRPEDELIADFYRCVHLAECNDACARMYGYESAGEIIGMRLDDFVPRSDPHNVAYLRAFINAGFRLHEVESHEIDKAGNPKYFLNNLIGIIEDGRLTRAWGTQRDITEQKRAEDELREADRRKDEFLAMLAHEVRNPLAAISNAIQVSKQAETAEQQGWGREVIDRQVKHLARLTDDLLDVSRITLGKIRLRKELLDLTPVLTSAAESVRSLIEERKHHLMISPARRPLYIEGDATRLEQIVTNLLANAAKYTEPEGRIELTATREEKDIVVSVKDTGVGIPADTLPRIFDLFVQGDRTLARFEGGLGIGLTLVRSLAEMHGGSVTASSEGPGKGSEFLLRLPAAEAPASECPTRRPEATRKVSRPSRILVVDDNVDGARGMTRLLVLLGHDVKAAYDGPSAIELAREQRPEFVLLDIGLPGMDGYQVAARLRQEESCKEAVIIAVTGYGQEQDRRRSREAGFDHHLVKPVDPDALLAVISR